MRNGLGRLELACQGKLYYLMATMVAAEGCVAPVDAEEEPAADDAEAEEEPAGPCVEDDEVEEPVAREIAAPGAPTLVERRHHELTHLPFAAWCDRCSRGRAPDPPHGLRARPRRSGHPGGLLLPEGEAAGRHADDDGRS